MNKIPTLNQLIKKLDRSFSLFIRLRDADEIMNYLPGFLDLFCGSGGASGFVLGGLPLPGTPRIASRADLSYIAPLSTGFIPARNNRISTVFCGIPRVAAISAKVNPSISLVSTKKRKKSSGNYYIFLSKEKEKRDERSNKTGR
jgi:hypothetical protein